jgi:hypothetical protein
MIYLILLTSLSLLAGDIQGEKVVLSSFKTFDEAKNKLKEIETKMSPNDIELRNKHHFDFVARKSGHAYIVVIEPIKTVDEATTILKHFKKTFADAYADHYYGPTQGAIILSLTPNDNTYVEPKVTNTPPSPISQKTVTPSAKMPSATERLEVEQKNQKERTYGWLWTPALIFIFIGGLIFVRKGFKSRGSSFDDNDLIQNDKIIVEEYEKNRREPNAAPIVFSKKDLFENTDIFYRFTQNIFFNEILRELKEACDTQDAQEVIRCMNEIEKYQKNFRRSSVIASMSRLVGKNGFNELSQLIEKETKQG